MNPWDPSPTAEEPPPEAGPPELPPLRIHHFLLWMAVASVVLAAFTAALKNVNMPEHPAQNALMALWLVSASLSVAALGVVLAAAGLG